MVSYGVSVKLDTASISIARIRAGLANKTYRPAISEAGKLVPSTKGICSRDRDADLMCAASF